MILEWKRTSLTLRHPFTIARGSKSTTDTFFVKLSTNDLAGIGEAAPSTRYGENADLLEKILKFLTLDGAPFTDIFHIESIDEALRADSRLTPSLCAALNIACWDILGQIIGQPLYRLWGLDPGRMPVTSFTIAIDTPDVIRRKVREAEPYHILKVKQGLGNDRAIIEAIRAETDKPIRVDANEGWDRDEALTQIEWLAERNAEYVEQPLPADRLDDTHWLRERSPLPLIADESCLTSGDIPRIAGAFDGINIKLMKCGGLSEAMRMIHTARAHGLSIMLGCMVESSVAITAAAHLAPLVDYVDLDGHLLVTDDPYEGVTLEDGRLILPDRPGIGIRPRHLPLPG